MTCRVCKRPLYSDKSRERGMGDVCWEHRTSIDQPELFGTPEGLGVKPKKELEVIDFDAIRGRHET